MVIRKRLQKILIVIKVAFTLTFTKRTRDQNDVSIIESFICFDEIDKPTCSSLFSPDFIEARQAS
jgi:hypothetical protein